MRCCPAKLFGRVIFVFIMDAQIRVCLNTIYVYIVTVFSELNRLTGDASSVRQFEMQIIPELAKLDSGTIIESNTTTVVIQKLDVGALGYGFRRIANLAPENIQFVIPSQQNRSSSFVNIPLAEISEKIRIVNQDPKRSERISELTLVMANWKATEALASSTNSNLPINSTVVSVSYYAQGERFTFPVSYEVDLEHDFTEFVGASAYEKYDYVNRTCSWLNISTGIWSQEGCRTVNQTSTKVKCECSHTTTFAVLLSVRSIKLPEGIRTLGLVLEIISIVSLALTIIFLAVARHGAGIDAMSGPKALGMQANRTNSQLSLCISLLFFHLSVVWSDATRYYMVPCYSVTALTHYFLLASAFWSFNEGIGIFIKMAPNLTLNLEYRKLTNAHVIIGWVLPLILTVTCLVYGVIAHKYIDISERYRILKEKSQNVEISTTLVDVPRYRECWLSKKNGLVWTALAPVALVVLVNFLILCYIARRVVILNKTVATYKARDARSLRLHESVYKNSRRGELVLSHEMDNLDQNSILTSRDHERRKQQIKHFLSGARSFAILLPVLAVPWLLAILTNIPGAEVPLSTAHIVINGLQGFEILILYCFIGKSDWQRVKRKWRNSGLRRMLSNYKPAKNIVSSAHTSHLATYNQTTSKNPKNSDGNLRLKAFVDDERIDSVHSDPYQPISSVTTISSRADHVKKFGSQDTGF